MDATGHEFATRMGNVFIIGKRIKPWISLPKDAIEDAVLKLRNQRKWLRKASFHRSGII